MSVKKLFTLNLTSLILLLGCIYLVFFSMNQCSQKKSAVESMKSQKTAYVYLENKIVSEYREDKKILRDSIEYYKELAEVNKIRASNYRYRINELKADLGALESKMSEIPFDSSYAFLSASNEAVGPLEYPFAGNQVRSMHTTHLERDNFSEMNKNLELENKYLGLSLIASGEMVVGFEKEIAACDLAMEKMQLELGETTVHNQHLKKKVWLNRGVAVLTSLTAFIMLL